MEDKDFYRAPEAVIVAARDDMLEVVATTKLRRFVHWLLDYVVVYGMILIFGITCALAGWEHVLDWMETVAWWQDQLITAAVLVAYYTVTEGLFGFSIGKLVTGTRVVDAEGRRITFGRAALRSVCRCIPFNAFSVLFADSEERRGWHDMLSKTWVVRRKRRATPPPIAAAPQFSTASDSTTISST